MKKNNSFINAIAQNKPVVFDSEKGENEISKDNNVEETEVIEESSPVKRFVSKKNDDKYLSFITDIIDKSESGKNKTVLKISEINHERIKKLSNMSGFPITELGDAILQEFFNRNRQNIEILIKKKSSF